MESLRTTLRRARYYLWSITFAAFLLTRLIRFHSDARVILALIFFSLGVLYLILVSLAATDHAQANLVMFLLSLVMFCLTIASFIAIRTTLAPPELVLCPLVAIFFFASLWRIIQKAGP